jgi:SAM-dependent methyltransferase
MQQTAAKLIQNWTPYNDSVIWDITHQYYKNKGLAAFSKQSDNLIPNDITTNYQSAKAFAEIIKANLASYGDEALRKRLRVLECGAGSGYFSRNLLYAAKDIGILDKMQLLITDYSANNLREIKASNMLKDFTEHEDYIFVELDAVNIDKAKDLNSNPYDTRGFSAVILNYVLDVLPLTVLKTRRNQKKGYFEEMEIKVMDPGLKNIDVISNANLMNELVRESRWVNYEFENQSELEIKYQEHLLGSCKDEDPSRSILYTYGALKACEDLLAAGDENCFLLSSDIPPKKGDFCQIVGNALAHEIDNHFIGKYLAKKGYYYHEHTDFHLSRILAYKNPANKNILENSFSEVFELNNMINRYTDLRACLNVFKTKESMDCMKYILEEFEKLAKYSLYVPIYWANYYVIFNDRVKAAEYCKQARELDYLNNYQLDRLATQLQQAS